MTWQNNEIKYTHKCAHLLFRLGWFTCCYIVWVSDFYSSGVNGFSIILKKKKVHFLGYYWVPSVDEHDQNYFVWWLCFSLTSMCWNVFDLGPEEEFNKLTPKMFLSRDDTCCLLFEQQTFARWLLVGCRQRTGVRSVRIKTEVSWLPGWRILDAPATTFTAGAGNKQTKK